MKGKQSVSWGILSDERETKRQLGRSKLLIIKKTTDQHVLIS